MSLTLLVSSLRVAHIAVGTLAVLVGAVALLSLKGGVRHRRAGRLFLGAMAVVIGSALVLVAIHFRPYLLALTLLSGFLTFSGWRVLGRKRPDLDPAARARPLDWAAALLTLSGGLLLLVLVARGTVRDNPPVLWGTAGGAVLHALYDLHRYARPTAFPFGPHLWRYEHILRMLGAYFATVAAFSGSVLTFLPEPWRQLWAPTLGQSLAIAWILTEWSQRRARRRAAAGTGAVRG